MKAYLAVILSWVLLVCSGLDAQIGALAAASLAQSGPPKPTLQERALEIPTGTLIEIRMHNKKKVRGRLAQITSDSVEIQMTAAGKIESRQFQFADVKSIRELRGSGSGSAKMSGVVAGLIAVGVLALIGLIVAVARGGPD